MFNRLQEAIRKAVELRFCVVASRLHAMHPGRYLSVRHLNTASRAVASLHNMIVEVRRDNNRGAQRAADSTLA